MNWLDRSTGCNDHLAYRTFLDAKCVPHSNTGGYLAITGHLMSRKSSLLRSSDYTEGAYSHISIVAFTATNLAILRREHRIQFEKVVEQVP